MIVLVIVWILLFTINFARAAESPALSIPLPQNIANDSVKSYAYTMVVTTFGVEYWNSFNSIIERESQWDSANKNPKSSASELGQLLDSTAKWLGVQKSNDPYVQVDHAILYIYKVYGDPNLALKFWKLHNYY